MSSNKTQKWSSSSSFSKLISRISRTLSFSSKKSQEVLKKNNQMVKPTESVIKNVNFVPQSAPVIRRHPPQPISKVLYDENYHRQVVHENMHVENELEEDDYDYSRYSLRPNLSLFNISVENLTYQSEENYQQVPRQYDWLDDIFHSTKIED